MTEEKIGRGKNCSGRNEIGGKNAKGSEKIAGRKRTGPERPSYSKKNIKNIIPASRN